MLATTEVFVIQLRISLVDPAVPTILRSWVRISSTTSMFFDLPYQAVSYESLISRCSVTRFAEILPLLEK